MTPNFRLIFFSILQIKKQRQIAVVKMQLRGMFNSVASYSLYGKKSHICFFCKIVGGIMTLKREILTQEFM